jgi:penicillin-binding protein 1C
MSGDTLHTPQTPSCPALCRASTPARDIVDGRDKPGHDGLRGRRLIGRIAMAAAFAFVLCGAATYAWINSLGPVPLAQAKQISTTVVDRNGKLLRAYAMADGRWRLPVEAKTAVDPGYLDLLLAYEDKRFTTHHGVDPLALGRAAFQFVTRGHIVSGGSTITMQLARLLEPRQNRNLAAKLRQAVRALQIEQKLSKNEILDLYLELAPFGGNLEGIRAASIAYFGKEPKRLSLSAAAIAGDATARPPPRQRPRRARPRARTHGA